MTEPTHSQPTRKPRIVSVLASSADLEHAGENSVPDLWELRVDRLVADRVEPGKTRMPTPAIITVRDSSEGGAGNWTIPERLELFRQWFDHASYLDIELRSWKHFACLVEQAQSAGVGIIVSVHNFNGITGLAEEIDSFLDLNPKRWEILKIAARLQRWEDVVSLAGLLTAHPRERIALMGMGPWGKLSRLVYARLGSELIYTSDSEIYVEGQWKTPLLQRLLPEIMG